MLILSSVMGFPDGNCVPVVVQGLAKISPKMSYAKGSRASWNCRAKYFYEDTFIASIHEPCYVDGFLNDWVAVYAFALCVCAVGLIKGRVLLCKHHMST